MIQPFPLWERPEHLADALRSLIAAAPPCGALAVTMTGELADCFQTKREGVARILQHLATAAEGRQTRVYLIGGKLVSTQVALRQPLAAAASNWHALARFAGRFAPQGPALLVDIGSTTTDLVPLVAGQPRAQGTNDPERLACGELFYTGVERSPVCAVVGGLPWRGRSCPVAQELFATTRDAYLVLGELPPEPDNTDTADRRGATSELARDRLARSICADREMFDDGDARAAAEAIQRGQLVKLSQSARRVLRRLPGPVATVIICGRGEFLARRLVEEIPLSVPVVSLSEILGPEISRCATAHALAVLAQEGV